MLNIQITNPIFSPPNPVGIHASSSKSHKLGHQPQQQPYEQQQHLIIEPIEFDYKHRNMYGYLSLAAFILVLINYIMIKERACQISLVNGYQNFDLIQGFHMTVIIVGVIVFVLSYFNFALVIYDFKLLFYASATLIFVCSAFLIYNAIAILSAPCVSINSVLANQLLLLFDTSVKPNATNIFAAGDSIGITVFVFDIIAAGLMFFAGRKFYQRC